MSPATIPQTFLRPLFGLFTLVVVVIAIIQASGRMGASVLHLFEKDLNGLLNSYDVSVEGLRGDWYGLNPAVALDRLVMPAAEVDGIDVEIDLLESLFRGTLVPRRLNLEGVSVYFEKLGQGWRLRGMTQGETPIDVQAVLQTLMDGPLRHVDNLSARVTAHFIVDPGVVDTEASSTARMSARLTLINRGGQHYARIKLSNDAIADQGVSFEGWQQEALLWVTEAATAGNLVGQLRVPQALVNMADLHLELEPSRWFDQGGQGGGYAQVQVQGVQLAGGAPTTVTAEFVGQRRGSEIDGRIGQFVLSSKANTLDIGRGFWSWQINPDELVVGGDFLEETPRKSMLRVWLADIDLAHVSTYLQDTLNPKQAAWRWIDALDLQGRASNIFAFYDNTGLGYRASIADLHMLGYKGAPTIENAHGEVWGYDRGVTMRLNGDNVGVQFPDLFHTKWTMDHISGLVSAWFAPGYLALAGHNLKTQMGDTSISGQFSLTRPDERYEQRVGLVLNVNQAGLEKAKTYVPYKIPQQLAEWVKQGPQAGDLQQASFAYHGQVHQRPGELGRRIELISGFANGAVKYDPAWPVVTAVQADVHVAGRNTRVALHRGRSVGIDLDNTRLTLVDNGLYADINLQATGDGGAVLEFVRSSPLQDNMAFVSTDWSSQGVVGLQGPLRVPLKDRDLESTPKLQAQLNIHLNGVDLAMPEYRTQLKQLAGGGQFNLPHHFSGNFSGQLFGSPVQITADSDDQWLWFDIEGRAQPGDIYTLIDYDQGAPIAGHFNFISRLNISVGDGVTHLTMNSDLKGLQVDLPAEFGKAAQVSQPIELDVQFLSDYQSLRWQYAGTNGWLHVGADIERGAIGINQPPPMTTQEAKNILISGSMPRLVLSDWVTDDDAALGLPVDWAIRNLTIGHFVIDELSFADMTLAGEQRGEDVSFQFAGEALQGVVLLPGDDLLTINLDYLRLPEAGASPALDPQALEAGTLTAGGVAAADPLSVEVGRNLPPARVDVAQLDLGETPFGQWRFVIEPQGNLITLKPFAARVNGVHISDSTVVWDLERNESRFSGGLELDDLEQTLPKWDYAASLQTTTATMDADLSWAGSPANLKLLEVSGNLKLNAQEGRFLEVERNQGGLRILSLINFSKIAKRINFDFSDVVGSGISFDRIDADISLRTGRLSFNEPMLVDSSSGLYRFGGEVDLDSGRLDNEMIVTLPVSNSLPWYGVYLALANPLAGLGVLVGERVLRKPIKQFSTAKFEVSGTLEDPKVEFVSLWDSRMRAPAEPVEDGGTGVEERPENFSPGEGVPTVPATSG